MNRPFVHRFVFVLLALGALTPGPAYPVPAQTKVAAAEMTGLKALGSRTAPITMEVFSDFQCPACRNLYQETMRPVIENYVAAGKVYYVHRDMPLPVHKHSLEASRYANAAARVGKFERVVEALFNKQETWSADGNIEGVVAAVLTPAEMNKVRQLLRSGQLDAAIDRDKSLAESFQVRQTPTTIITFRGQTYPIVGVVSYAILRRFLDDLLKK